MRVENIILAWVGTAGLAVAGPIGLYMFDFLTGTPRPFRQILRMADHPAPLRRIEDIGMLLCSTSAPGKDVQRASDLLNRDLTAE